MNFPDLTEIARVGPHRGANQFPISPDGRWVATATWKGKDVNVWEVATGQLVLQIPSDSGFVRFSPDGRWLAVIKFPGQVCELWQVGTWERTHSIRVSTEFLTIAFTKDGRFMAIDDGGRVRLLETETGRSIATLDTGTGSLATFFCLAVSPDATLVAAGRDHMVFLWDLRRIRKQLALRGLDWVAPSFPPFIAQPALDSIVVIGAEAEGLPEASAREAR
jgi:WD40 repeat protein